MRASQRPGASTSAGVGQVRSASAHRRLEAVGAGPLDDAGDERRAAVVGGLGELEAEELLDEAVAGVGLDPAAAQGLGELAVARR